MLLGATKFNGIHVHLDSPSGVEGSPAKDNDAGTGAIKVPAGVTLVVDKPEYLKWDGQGDGLVFYIFQQLHIQCQ